MFDKLKKALLGQDAPAVASPAQPVLNSAFAPVSEWAKAQGFGFSGLPGAQSFSLHGKVAGKPWRMEVGKPSRAYIRGEELRARAELGLNENIAVMVMNRALKESLEKQAYERFTDDLQTTVDTSLPEEVRWLAMLEDCALDSLSRLFLERYAVLADQRDNAVKWVDPVFANQLLTWPAPAPGPDVPFVLMVLRGKAYLRMQQTPGDMPSLQHAAQVFTAACESAVGAFTNPA